MSLLLLRDSPAPITMRSSSAEDATLRTETKDSCCSGGTIDAFSLARSIELMLVVAPALGVRDIV